MCIYSVELVISSRKEEALLNNKVINVINRRDFAIICNESRKFVTNS